MEKQKTIFSKISFKGIGLHTGKKSKITLKPSKENSGIVFKRTDLIEPVFIKAVYDNVISTDRGTTIGNDNVKIHTIEHILSAVYALGIDNLLIEIDNVEPPILDGSSVICFHSSRYFKR